MPSWPTQSDYKDALQNPDTAFRDADLKLSKAERSPMGVPKARSGAFASVYKMDGPKGTVALKVFNFPNEDRAQRYKAVSDYLEKELGPKKPPCVVQFQYHLEGIRVGKGWFPTLTMAWVKGVSLGEWVRQTVEKKNPDVAAVRKMCDAWAALVQQLQEKKIAHGDLQHDNVMVVNDAPILVDYDGMCVPALDPPDPTKKLDQLEFGKPAYQHPARAGEKLNLQLDNFSAWVILIALRAIAADPQLYVKHVLKTDNENLLFTPQDMQYPDSSQLWPDLMRCKDPDVSRWARMLRESIDKPFAKIPPFELEPPDPFAALRKLLDEKPPDPAKVKAETARLKQDGKVIPADLAGRAAPLIDPMRRLKELCGAAKKDWPAIVAEAGELARTGEQVPADLKKVADDGRARVAARDALKTAADARDPRALVAAYKPLLVDDWADRDLVNAAKNAAGQVALLDRLKAAVANPGDGKALVKLWDECAPKLAGVREAEQYKRVVDDLGARVRAAEDFVRVYSQTGATERMLADAWQAVVAAGPPHLMINNLHRKRGEDATRWAPLVEKLRRVPAAASYDNDAALIAAWGTGAALAGCREAAEFSSRVNDANARLALVQAVERAVKAADAGAPDNVVVEAAAKLPGGYAHPFETRVAEGATSIKLLDELRKVANAAPPSDRKIARAFEQLKTKGPKLAKRLDKVDPALYAEVTAAAKRRKIFDQFAQIDVEEPRPDKQDEKWLALWARHRDELKGRRDCEELRERYTLARERTENWKKLAEALASRDMFTLRRRYNNYADQLAGYPPLIERLGEIQALLAKADRIFTVQEKLTAGGVLAAEDLSFLRDNHDAFGPETKREIEKQVRARLSTDAKLVPAYPAYQVTGSRGGLVKACWAWGGHGLISYCVVGVDGRKFLTNPDEADQYSRLTCKAADHQREGGGITLVPPRGAAQAFVTIWPVVELGWTTVHGPPLNVGPVPIGRY